MKNKQSAPLNILLTINDSKYSMATVRFFARIAWPAGTSVHVLAVVPERLPLGGFSRELQSMMDESLTNTRRQEWATAEKLAALAANTLRARDLTAEVEVCEGRPAEIILERAAMPPTDLIVIGAKGLSAPGELRLGSTTHKLIHYAGCSVLVVRPLEQTQRLRTLLATDGSLEPQRAAEFLGALSPLQWTAVTVVSVAEAEMGIAVSSSKGRGAPLRSSRSRG